MEIIYWIVVALFPLSEILFSIQNRSSSTNASSKDHGSMRLLWISIAIGISLAVVTEPLFIGKFFVNPQILTMISLLLMFLGVFLRRLSIHILGSFFTVDVAVFKNHTVCEKGPYQWIRHPSYTGLIIYFFGLAISFGNIVSLATMLIPIIFAILYRVKIEESALSNSLGESYQSYMQRTKRFLPFIL